MQISVLALAAGVTLAAASYALAFVQDEPEAPADQPESLRTQPVEIGTVAWLRDIEAAKAEAARTEKPILLLFQEVPG